MADLYRKAFAQRFPPQLLEEIRQKQPRDVASWEYLAEHLHEAATGTLVVWDVDLQSDDVIKSYKASDPDNPVIFRRGEIADAEPAVPGWGMAVDELFE